LDLLAFCIREGAADFVLEKILQQPVVMPYTIYGLAHEGELWKRFKTEMDGKDLSNWLYNGSCVQEGSADLDYFIGHQICKAYYQRATDKQLAVKQIIELNYNDSHAIHEFLCLSKYSPASN
jgi:hypothetical protein